jgi:hypothetical protein
VAYCSDVTQLLVQCGFFLTMKFILLWSDQEDNDDDVLASGGFLNMHKNKEFYFIFTGCEICGQDGIGMTQTTM